jgi:hypothetical protein
MKLKALLLALFVAGLTASFALADDGHGKGDKGKSEDRTTSVRRSEDTKGDRATTARCRPSVEVELRGTVAAAPTASSLVVLVTRGGAEGASLAGKQLTFDTTGARKPSALASGDLVQVKGRACVDLVAGTAKLVAERVESGKGGEPRSTSTTTTSTSTTTTVATTSTTAR